MLFRSFLSLVPSIFESFPMHLIVFCHGFGGSHDYLRQVISCLSSSLANGGFVSKSTIRSGVDVIQVSREEEEGCTSQALTSWQTCSGGSWVTRSYTIHLSETIRKISKNLNFSLILLLRRKARATASKFSRHEEIGSNCRCLIPKTQEHPERPRGGITTKRKLSQ